MRRRGMNTRLTLILGGVSSGKSVHAEQIAQGSGVSRLYVATAQPHDDEMAAKIRVHQSRRGAGWTTAEAPLDLGPALTSPDADVVLLDCVSMWLSNHLLAENDIDDATRQLTAALQACPVPIIAVSNEVGLGGVAANSLARRFATEQGRLNQRLAAMAHNVHLVTAGIALPLKGSL